MIYEGTTATVHIGSGAPSRAHELAELFVKLGEPEVLTNLQVAHAEGKFGKFVLAVLPKDKPGLFASNVTLGEALRGIRESRCMSPKQFADLLGIAPEWLLSIEVEMVAVSPKVAVSWALILDYPAEAFKVLAYRGPKS